MVIMKMWDFLIIINLMSHSLDSSSYRESRQTVTIPAKKCENPDAFTLKCMGQNTQEIPSGGEVRRHEKILIEVAQITGRCTFTIPEYMVLIVPPDKLFDSNKVNWAESRNFPSNPSQTTKYELPPFTIKNTGSVTIQVIPVEMAKESDIADSKKCEVNVVYAKPEISLDGGSEKLYKANIESTVKCEAKNYNNEDPNSQTSGLTFSWKCSTVKGSAPEFCSQSNMDKFKDKNTLIIPATVAKGDNSFDVKVEVGLSETAGYEVSVSQKVGFHVSIGTLKVKCLKNCPPKSESTLSSMSTVLKSKCFNCNPSVVVTWTIKDSREEESVDYNYLKNRDGFIFYLKAGALKDNEIYTVKVQEKGLEDSSLHAEFKLSTKLPPSVKNCSVNPPTGGVAMKTGFAIECTYFPGDITFEINSVKNGKKTLVAKTTDLEREIFMLPADVSLVLNIYHGQIGFTQSIELTVEVKEAMDLGSKNTDAEINDAVNGKVDDVLEFINDGHPELALQGLAAIVGEYGNLPPGKQDLIKSLDKTIMKVISKVNIDSPIKAQQVADTLSHITGRYNASSDPEISAESTALCTKAGDVLLNEAKHAKRPDLMREQIQNSVKSLSMCSQAGLHENRDSVSATNSTVIVPEEVPVIPSNQPAEFYPEYADDEHSSENMAKFEKSAQSMKQICFTNGKMLASTMVPEEDPIITTIGSLTIAVARMNCEDTPFSVIETPDANLKPNSDCSTENIPIIDILICSTKQNPFWYIDNIPMLTPVIYAIFSGNQAGKSSIGLDIVGGRNENAEFKDPVRFTFPIHENVSIDLKIHEAPLPDKSVGALDEDSFYEKLSTHRISVFKNRTFTISFENMASTDMYDIMVTNFEKPNYEQFKSLHKTINSSVNFIGITQIQDYDSFWYLSLLPNVNMGSTSNKNYAFSVSTAGCYSWNASAKQWFYACHGASGQPVSQNISCYCTYGEIFTGYVIDNRVAFEETLILDFELELRFCWIIYGVVMGTFGLFCLLLFLYSLERDDNILDRVFFVGDVPSYYQYAYVIDIKTGSKRHSGTTSNVSIKLRGTKGPSMEHVLNYPDPKLTMLQRGTENWFVVATEKPLGDLKQIEIWFDSIGNNEKWYCSKIDVYDIQTEESWSFVLEEWFDVTKQEHDMFILQSTKETKVKTNEKRKNPVLIAIKSFLGKIKEEVNLWNLFSSDPLLTKTDRVFLIFSILLLMYLIIMILYSIPSFDESDVIDSNRFGLHQKLIWTPVAGSTTAFLVHLPLVYLIKRGKFSSLNTHKFKKLSIKFTSNLCWILIGFNCLTAATALIMCGFWIPMDTSLLWLVSVLLAIIFNIFILQTISCIILSYLVRLPVQVQSFTKGIIDYIDLQRTWIYKRFGTVGVRPYLNHLYSSLDPITLKEKVKWAETKTKIKELLEDLLMISLYVSMLYVVLMIDKEPEAINSNDEIKRLIMGKVVDNEMAVKTVEDIENYTGNVLLPSFQSMHWYGNFVQNNPGMTKDFSNKYLGVVRMRQQRTKEIQCNLPEIINFLNLTCRPDFSVLRETGNFARGWKPETELSNITTERMAKVWKYTAASGIADTPSFFGEYSVYPGGGYIAPLGRNLKNSLVNLEYLKRHKWLDLRTRAVFIEFLTYNPNVNIFNSVTVAFEVPCTGHVERSLKLQTRKFLVVNRDTIFTRNVLYSCFAVMLFVLLCRIFFKIIKKKHRYFYDIWQIFDIFIATLSGLAVLLYYLRSKQILAYISDISDAKNNEFVNYFQLFKADSSLTFLTACLIFVATLRLWKLLRFMIIVQITEKTLQDSAIPLLVCLIFQMVYVVAFTVAGALMFGYNIKRFRNLRSSFITLLLLSIGLVEIDNEKLSQEPLGITYFLLYMLFSTFFLTVYVAIISIYYEEAHDYYGNEPGFVQQYVSEKWTYYKTLMLVRLKQLRGGEDPPNEELILKPTAERYDDCYIIPKSRLDGMAFVSMCVLRNLEEHRTFGSKDFELMSKMIIYLYGEESSQKEIFFTIRDQQHIKLIDDRKISQIADICEKFIKESSMGYSRISRKYEKPWIEERISRINNLIDNVKLIERVLNNIRFN